MDTSRIMPPGRVVPTPEDLARLPMTALLLACLDPRFKRLTGWQGLARCPESDQAWTCRLEHRPGIFGWLPEDCRDQDDGCLARFGLHYFPTPDDPLLDRFSLAATWAALKPDFPHCVRKFAAFPALSPHFRLGEASLAHHRAPSVFTFRYEALERDIILLEAGLHCEQGWVVQPGESEQDLPAWELGLELFQAVAGALSFGLGCPPAVAVRSSRPDTKRVREADGTLRAESPGPTRRSEALAWGEAAIDREPELSLSDAATRQVWAAGAPLPDDLAGAPCYQVHAAPAMTDMTGQARLSGERPGLVILTGFLGAGKTTLLLEMLEHLRAHDQFVAIIQNELGATGVDEHLLDGGESTLALDEGCVCCSLSGSLAGGIKRLSQQFHPSRIILETSGLANPGNLLREQAAWADLARLEMVVTVVDAVHGLDMLAASDVAGDQIRYGDVLVVNKCDLAGPAAQEALDAKLREFNPHAPILHTNHGQLHPGLLFDAGNGLHEAHTPSPHPLLCRRNHLDEAFGAIRLPQPEGLTLGVLQQWIERLPANVFRFKGILRLRGMAGEPMVLQGVGRRWTVEALGHPFADEPFLVCIGRGLCRERLLP